MYSILDYSTISSEVFQAELSINTSNGRRTIIGGGGGVPCMPINSIPVHRNLSIEDKTLVTRELLHFWPKC